MERKNRKEKHTHAKNEDRLEFKSILIFISMQGCIYLSVHLKREKDRVRE